ncbi:hypothetical protein IMG5_129420 [Ichthyophthirius multifiliis]|uniref:Serine hydrolase domain-containing protein n=1 Tax=Ichthyophthirius multifiliis TaxID=5932 RepID=G0QW53_ICHMU|nr:hypothetical protein IMG5_129420 [Ichthyophthirius multifiliis]EGR30556.1 hypothetical protein IMG5_129420 [Ichthyophthirius multifiliis]|eukprot:XP_004032143.1 hypothetical protein IMG5_129420 [Ichthyophthirius multifiliis]
MQFNKIFFRPPSPTYTSKEFKGTDRYFEIPSNDIKKNKSTRIPCLLMPYILNQQNISKYYIVYFHGNAEDLGTSYDFLYDLRNEAKCNILLTEYGGYGLYQQTDSSVKQIEYDSEIVLIYINEVLKTPKQNIILLGRSMGSGPACLLASKYQVRGLMLISAFTSLRDVAKKFVGSFISKIVQNGFQNIDLIDKILCPILIIHGKNDKLVPVKHAHYLADKVNNRVTQFYQNNMTHNDYDFDKDIKINILTFLKEKMFIYQEENDPILSKFEVLMQEKFIYIYPEYQQFFTKND